MPLITIYYLLFTVYGLYANYKYESSNEHEVVVDITINGGGAVDKNDIQSSNLGYTDDGCQSLPGGTTCYDHLSGTDEDAYAGWTPNINNISTVTARIAPVNDVWISSSRPVFKWEYLDYDGNLQSGCSVQLSTDVNFGTINYGVENDSSQSRYQPSTDINCGTYFWRVRVRDNYWNEWSAWSSTYCVKIDTIPPTGASVTGVTAYISSCAVALSAAVDQPGLSGLPTSPYKIRYSTSTTFETNCSTTTDWFQTTSTSTLTLSPNTTYYFQAKACDNTPNESDWSATFARETLCAKPTGLYWDETTTTTIKIGWGESTPPVTSPDAKYVVDLSSVSSDFTIISGSSITVHSKHFAVVKDLSPNTTYWCRVSAVNYNGISTITQISTATVTKPSVPRNLKWGDATNYYMEVKWSSSTPDNPLSTVYKVELSSTNFIDGQIYSTTTTRGNNGSVDDGGSVIVKPLTPNTTYYGRVTAINWNSYFVSSATVELPEISSVTLCSGATTAYWNEVKQNSVKIAWYNTEQYPNPSDTRYVVDLSTTVGFTPTTYQSIETTAANGLVEFTGLTQNTNYWFRVHAINRRGCDIVFTYPDGKCTGVKEPIIQEFAVADVGQTGIVIRWGANGNPPGTAYIVQKSTWNGFTGTLLGGTTIFLYWDFSSLTPNTTHWFRVRAKNTVGECSDWTSVVSTVTLCNVPGDFRYTDLGVNIATVTWTNNSNNTDGAGTCYQVMFSSNSQMVDAVVSTYTFASIGETSISTGCYNLVPNTTYYTQARAFNALGIPSAWTAQISTITFAAAPSDVRWDGVYLESATVRWTQSESPAQNPDDTIYITQLSTASDFSVINGSSTTVRANLRAIISNLYHNIKYYGRVVAVNRGGVMAITATVPVSTSTFAGVPPAVTLLSPTTWTVAVRINTDANSPETKYAIKLSGDGISGVKYVQNGGFLADGAVYKSTIEWCDTGASTITVKGLLENTSYSVFVAAQNQDGVLTEDSPVVSTYTLLNAPSGFSFTMIGVSSVTLSVAEPPNPTSGCTGSEFEGNGYDWKHYTYTKTALSANTEYGYKVRYFNGDKQPTAWTATGSTYTLMDPPKSLTVTTVSAGMLQLESDIFNNHIGGSSGFQFTQVFPSAESSSWQKYPSPPSPYIWQHANLAPNTTHTYRVDFRNGNAVVVQGTFTATGCTFATTPSQPQIVDTAVSTSTIGISFGTGANPYYTEYSIKIASGGVDYYLQTDSTLADNIVYQTTMTWGQDIVVRELLPNTSYTVSVDARNLFGVSTAYSVSTATRTLAEVPGVPTFDGKTSGSIVVKIEPKANSPETTYSIKCVTEDTTYYVQPGGTLLVGASAEQYQTFSQWGGTGGVNVTGLSSGLTYNFAVRARNGCYIVTDFSDSASETTDTVDPVLEVVAVTTNTVSIKIVSQMSPSTKFAIKDVIDGTDYYVQTGSTLSVAGSGVYQKPADWCVNCDTITIWGTGLLPNQQHNLSLSAKNWNGTQTLYNFGTINTSTWTLSEQPSVTLGEVTTDTVTVHLDVGANLSSTVYALRCVVYEDSLISGTTRYLQYSPDDGYSLGSNIVWYSTADWKTQDFSVYIATPNMPVDISMVSKNGAGRESAYSVTVSTSTKLEKPDIPTVVGCYNATGVGDDHDRYYFTIFINSRNSKHTQYAIRVGDKGSPSHVKNSGNGYTNTESLFFWATKADWHSGKNINSKNGLVALLPGNWSTYWVRAKSTKTGEEEESDPCASLPLASFEANGENLFTVTATSGTNSISINWPHTCDGQNFTKYAIKSSTNNGATWENVNTSVSKDLYAYSHDVDGSTPTAPSSSSMSIGTSGKTATISWSPSTVSGSGLSYKYKVSAMVDVAGEQPFAIITSSPSNPASVTPVITRYKVYESSTAAAPIATPPLPTVTIGNLPLNKSTTFWISALSSDGFESERTPVKVHPVYSYDPAQVTITIKAAQVKPTINNIIIGVPQKPKTTVEFSKVIDTITVSGISGSRICITKIRDNNDVSKSENVSANLLTSNTSTTTIVDVDVSNLDYGCKYKLDVNGVEDLNAPPLPIYSFAMFQTLINFNTKNSLRMDTTNYLKIENPSNTYNGEGYITTVDNPVSDAINTATGKLSAGYMVMSSVGINIYAVHSNYDEPDTQLKQFEKEFTITIGYTDNDNDGFVDPCAGRTAKIRVDTLSIWHLDEKGRVFMKLPTEIDKVRKVLIAKTKQFSVFAVVGSAQFLATDVKVVPVPWIPEDGKAITGTLEGGIKFVSLPDEGEIAIYTIAGDLVKKITFENGQFSDVGWKWDGKNGDGVDVASGVYLWMVKAPGGQKDNKKTGKLIIVR